MEKVNNRFIFDTNAINRICEDHTSEAQIYKSKFVGFEYYFSEIQCSEAGATMLKERKDENLNTINRSRAEYAFDRLRVIPKLQTQYVGKIATLRPNGWPLDGTVEISDDEELPSIDMFMDILHENDQKYYNDAMIAMIGIQNGCTIVTNDKRLKNKVNHHFPGRAISFEEFMEIIQNS